MAIVRFVSKKHPAGSARQSHQLSMAMVSSGMENPTNSKLYRAAILRHRISYDVYIFLDSSTVLKNLAPNMNPATKSLCDTWQWPGKYLKLILRDVGEIDFMNAPSYTDNPTYQLRFGERFIAAERSAEIATKKLLYRASTYTARDTFDLAAIYLYDCSALGEIAQSPAITHHVVSSALNRLNLAKRLYQSEMRRVINATPRGEEFIDKSCEIALEALAEIQNLIPKNETEPSNGTSFSRNHVALKSDCGTCWQSNSQAENGAEGSIYVCSVGGFSLRSASLTGQVDDKQTQL